MILGNLLGRVSSNVYSGILSDALIVQSYYLASPFILVIDMYWFIFQAYGGSA